MDSHEPMEIQILAPILKGLSNPIYNTLRLQKRVQSKSNPINERTRAAPKKHTSTQAAARTRKPPQQKHPPHQRAQKRHYDEV